MDDELRDEYDLKSLRVRKLGPDRRSFSNPIPNDFRGLLWEPSSEQEVVMLFGQLLDYLPQKLGVEFIQTPFPDCKAVDLDTEAIVWIEFELYSSHFRDHGHPPGSCHWIVCWHDDLNSQSAKGLPKIVALDKIVDSLRGKKFIINRRPPDATQEQYFRLRTFGLSRRHQKIIHRLLEFTSNDLVEIEWPPKTNGACFTVRDKRDGLEYFKVNSNGMIGVPFSRWQKKVGSVEISQLACDLNLALDTDWFKGKGKLSIDIVDLIGENEDALARFIRVWRKFATDRSPAIMVAGSKRSV